MLDKINQIDWASRNAVDVPTWIQQLASGNKELARNAYEHLSHEVIQLLKEDFDDGKGISIILKTDTPLLIVPFLVEVLAMATSYNKTRILGMLTLMTGYIELDFEGKEFEERAYQIYKAIWAGNENYLELLEYPDSSVRSQAVSLLCQFHDQSEVTLPYILHAIDQEQVEEAKKWMTKQLECNFSNGDRYSDQI